MKESESSISYQCPFCCMCGSDGESKFNPLYPLTIKKPYRWIHRSCIAFIRTPILGYAKAIEKRMRGHDSKEGDSWMQLPLHKLDEGLMEEIKEWKGAAQISDSLGRDFLVKREEYIDDSEEVDDLGNIWKDGVMVAFSTGKNIDGSEEVDELGDIGARAMMIFHRVDRDGRPKKARKIKMDDDFYGGGQLEP